MKSLLRTVLAGILLSTLFVAVSASPAAAAVQVAFCSGTYEATYDPGMTFTPQDIHSTTTSNYDCLSTDHTITGASTGPISATLPDVSCLQLLEPLSQGQTTLTWNTGETTVYDWTATASKAGDTTVVTIIGTVAAGKFAGAMVERVSTFIQEALEAQCSTSEGLTHVEGDATLTITKLL